MDTTSLSPWLALADVVEHVTGKPAGDGPAPAGLERARAAAGRFVERMRPDLAVTTSTTNPDGTVTTTTDYQPSADVQLGAILLAARWHSRRVSPAGLATFAEFGAAPILHLDVDVERLLGLGRNARPRIG